MVAGGGLRRREDRFLVMREGRRRGDGADSDGEGPKMKKRMKTTITRITESWPRRRPCAKDQLRFG
jgi:hypothetical protein